MESNLRIWVLDQHIVQEHRHGIDLLLAWSKSLQHTEYKSQRVPQKTYFWGRFCICCQHGWRILQLCTQCSKMLLRRKPFLLRKVCTCWSTLANTFLPDNPYILDAWIHIALQDKLSMNLRQPPILPLSDRVCSYYLQHSSIPLLCICWPEVMWFDR